MYLKADNAAPLRYDDTGTLISTRTIDWQRDTWNHLIGEQYGDSSQSNYYHAKFDLDLASNRLKKSIDTTGDTTPEQTITYG